MGINRETFFSKKTYYILLKVAAFILFCVYLSQMYVKYAIDYRQVLPSIWTIIILILRWTTIVTVGFAVIVPFFGGINLKAILSFLGPIIGIVNLVLFKYNMISWGYEAYSLWRSILFIIEQVLILIISCNYFIAFIKNKEYKQLSIKKIAIIIPAMYLTFFYQPIFNILFGEYGEKTLDFSFCHILSLSLNFLFLIFSYILMRNKKEEEKKIFFAALSCSGVFNFFYYKYYGLGNLPLHLCNTAIIMMFLAYIFNIKGIFYFTYFVNVIGALFAMLMPNVTTDFYALGSVRFWYNHIYAFCLPILGVALKVYERPKLKLMGKAIFWFGVYFVSVIFFNSWFSNYEKIDYFFINSNFLFEKLNIKTTIKDNYVWQFSTSNNLIFTFYPLFYLIVFTVYIGLMFLMWYIYDAFYHIADTHYDLRIKKKLIRQKNKRDNTNLYINVEDNEMIEIKNFTKIYSGSKNPSVDNLSLNIKNGEVYGFLGHNGAGKSTTIKSIVGIQSITSGQIIVEGYDVEKNPVEAKMMIGYVSDNHALYERLTGREYINYIADLYLVNQKDRDERLSKYLKMYNLEDAIDREIKSYSHGMKQKITVIASLIHNPKVWILDEPLTGLDPMSSYQIKECMKEQARNGNIVFFSSHVIEVVEKVCDRICIISHGKLQCEFSLKELKEKNISLEELYIKYVSNEDKSHED